MFKDMDLARDEITSYNTLLSDRGQKFGPDLHVNVLSAAAWPTYPDVAVNVPTSISKAQYDFEQHYKAKYNGRKLTWKHALAHCQLRARFPKGNKELVVSGFQALVLLLFNDVPDGGSLSYADIQAATALCESCFPTTLPRSSISTNSLIPQPMPSYPVLSNPSRVLATASSKSILEAVTALQQIHLPTTPPSLTLKCASRSTKSNSKRPRKKTKRRTNVSLQIATTKPKQLSSES